MYLIKITPVAQNELTDLTEYIARDSPSNATKFVSELLKKVTSLLSEFPDSGRLHKEIGGIEYRKITFKRYTTFYYTDKDSKTVHIVHIVDQTKPLEERELGI